MEGGKQNSLCESFQTTYPTHTPAQSSNARTMTFADQLQDSVFLLRERSSLNCGDTAEMQVNAPSISSALERETSPSVSEVALESLSMYDIYKSSHIQSKGCGPPILEGLQLCRVGSKLLSTPRAISTFPFPLGTSDLFMPSQAYTLDQY